MKKLKKIKISKNLLVFSIFVLIATILWFLNALEKNYTTSIILPVEFYGYPTNTINISHKRVNSLKLNIKGKGFDIMRFQFKKHILPLKIDLAQIGLKKIKLKDANYFIISKNIAPQIEMQLPSNLILEGIIPDTIYFLLVKSISKKVKIIPNIKISLQKQYALVKQPYVVPDTAILTGPENIVDTTYFVYTNFIYFTGVNKSIKHEVEVLSPEYTIVSPSKVKLIIEVEQYTEKILQIPIKVINLPDTIQLLTFPNQVEVKAKVSFSKYDSIKSDLFEAVVDYNEVKTAISDKLTVEMRKIPNFIYDYEYKPHFVEYILQTKKND